MSRTLCSRSLYGVVLLLPFTCFAQADKVEDYATACYKALGISENGADMESAFEGTNRACRYGTKLTTRHNGIALDPVNPAPGLNLVPGKTNFLSTCDTPAWLPSAGPSQCYDATWIKALSFNNHPNVQGALLCRHKTRDPALDSSRTPTDDDFDDVAMILHDRTTGTTCWFQTDDGGVKLDGNHVPVPHLVTPPPGVPAASDFWLKPSVTAQIQCAQCHDNGPWMNSQWLYEQFPKLENKPENKYKTVEYGTAFKWKTDDFVTVGKSGIKGPFPSCTRCHKLAARGDWPFSSLLESTYNGTYQRWFAYATGKQDIPQSTATEHNPRLPSDYAYTHWMPTEGRPADAAEYTKAYETHLKELKICMETDRAVREAARDGLKPDGLAPESLNCSSKKLVMLNSAPAGVGALVSATVSQTGRTYSATAAPLAGSAPPVASMLAVGSSLRLAWQADATFDACRIEATMPPGVLVSATSASGSKLIGSGANWQLPETPPLVGPLTESGIYDFSIYCRDTYAGSVQFQVGTAGPNSFVKLVTSVNKAVQAAAVHSNSLMQPFTTTNVQNADSVEVTWIAYNVRPGSCILNGPGVTSNDEVGSQVITASGPIDQTFTFQCTGANDGVMRSVSSTLHPVPSSCSYSIAPTTASAPAAGGTGSIAVTAPPACTWAVSGTPGWIAITSGGNGSGNGTIVYSVQANTGNFRTGTLNIAGQSFTVTQAAQASVPLSATLSSSVPPVGKPDPMSALGSLSITILGGTAGQRMAANVAVYLNTNLAVVPDTAVLMDASGATISAVKATNAYTFLNVQFEQPGASGTRVYSIKNMKANTMSIPIPASGPGQVIAMVAISGVVPLPLSNPSQIVAFVNRNVAPTADSVTPGSGRGSSQIFRLAYSDADGYLDLVSTAVLFTSNNHQKKQCRVDYDRPNNALYLRSDAGPVRGPITPGSAGTLQNSTCELNAAASSVAGSGNTLTLNLSLAFRPSFAGEKSILMLASDGTLTSGLQARGTWIIP